MSSSNETPYEQPLADGLTLHAAANEEDVAQVATFNSTIHGPDAGALTRNLFLHHPATRLQDLFFVKDRAAGRVVSSLCLIPWTWRYGDVKLPVGELGIAGTSEAYRQRGLMRALVRAFKGRLRERGCLLSQIQGIPYFYRQFGYEYALPLEGSMRLEFRQIPLSEASLFTFRQATPDDVDTMRQLYDEATQTLAIHSVRDEAAWQYLQRHTEGTSTERERWIIQSAGGEIAGYVSVPRYHFGEEITVDETSLLGFDAALATLQHIKKLAVEREKPGIRLNLPANCTLMRLAESLDGHDMGTYAWQIHVPDTMMLLQALGLVLERRIANSPFAGLSEEVGLDLYRERIVLRFEGGSLTRVAPSDSARSTGAPVLRCPPLQFIPLVLGDRTWEELRSSYPDVSVPRTRRLLVDTLFPRVTAFLYSPY